MNVYDFDNTIYDGESVVDFYLFLLKKNPRLIKMLPKVLEMLIRYKACRISEEELYTTAQHYAAKLFHYAQDNGLLEKFWEKNQKKIKSFYLENQKEDDVILSASCDFLIDYICKRLGIKTVIASKIDIYTGEITQICYRKNKVELFKKYFPNTEIDEFYTDSMNDKPMFELSKKVYLVKGNKVKELIR